MLRLGLRRNLIEPFATIRAFHQRQGTSSHHNNNSGGNNNHGNHYQNRPHRNYNQHHNNNNASIGQNVGSSSTNGSHHSPQQQRGNYQTHQQQHDRNTHHNNNYSSDNYGRNYRRNDYSTRSTISNESYNSNGTTNITNTPRQPHQQHLPQQKPNSNRQQTAALQGTSSKPFSFHQIKDRDPIGGAHVLQKQPWTSQTANSSAHPPRVPAPHHCLAVLVDIDTITVEDFLKSITPIVAEKCGPLSAEFAGNKKRAVRAPVLIKPDELPLEITSPLQPPTDLLQQAGTAYFPSIFGRGNTEAEEDLNKKSVPATLPRHLHSNEGAVCLLRCYGHGRLSLGWQKCLTAIGTEVQARKRQFLSGGEATQQHQHTFLLPSTQLVLSSYASIEYFQVDEFMPTAMQITAEIGHLLHHSPTNLLTGIVTCVGQVDRAGFLYECMRHQRHFVSQYIVTKNKLEGTSFGPVFTDDD